MQCPTLRPEFARGDVALLCGCLVSWGAVVWDSRKGLCRNAGAVGGVELLLVRVSSQHAVIFPMQTRQLHVNIHNGYIHLKLKRCKKKNMQTAELRLSYKQNQCSGSTITQTARAADDTAPEQLRASLQVPWSNHSLWQCCQHPPSARSRPWSLACRWLWIADVYWR